MTVRGPIYLPAQGYRLNRQPACVFLRHVADTYAKELA